MIAGVGEAPGEKPAAVLEAAGLRAVFVRHGDRFAHRIEVRDKEAQQWITAAESLEGTDDNHWPPSPPFQQLHVERRKEGEVVLLVGMAGRSHWSAAVDVCPERKTLRFDVAVRVQAGAELLGSAYEIVAVQEAAAVVATVSPGALMSGSMPAGSDFRFEPDVGEAVTFPATICWKYSLRLREPG